MGTKKNLYFVAAFVQFDSLSDRPFFETDSSGGASM